MNKYPNTLLEYTHIRNNPKKSINGAIVAIGRNQVGWSLCAPQDKFNKEKALMIATARAGAGSTAHIPHTIKGVYDRMLTRSERYFKVQSL